MCIAPFEDHLTESSELFLGEQKITGVDLPLFPSFGGVRGGKGGQGGFLSTQIFTNQITNPFFKSVTYPQSTLFSN